MASAAPKMGPSALRSPTRPVAESRLGPPETLRHDDVIGLQRDAGNQAVQRLVGGSSMLRKGSSGPEVSKLQQALIGAGAQLKADGSFGPATHAAVVELQKGAGLTPDGIVGPKTWGALGGGGGGAAGEKAPPEKVVLLKTKLAMLQARIAELGGKPDASKEASSTPTVEPEVRGGWLDDAADWASDAVDTVGDVASSVADTVGDVASDVAGAVGSAVSGAGEWVADKAGDIAEAVGGAAGAAGTWVEEKVGAAGQWIGDKADDVGGFVDGVVDGLGQQLESLGEDVSGLVAPLVGPIMAGVAGLGGGIGLSPAQVDDLIAKVEQALSGLDDIAAGNNIFGDEGIELGGGTKGGNTDYSVSAKVGSKYTFSNSDFNSLLAALTARQSAGEEIGSCLPSVTYTLNGVDEGAGLADDDKVTGAAFTVVDNIQLPDWTNVSTAQPAQQKEWGRYASGVAAHENLHAADDKGFLGALHAGCLGKTVKQAREFVDKQITDSNNQSPVRDTSSPPPTLNPAGTTKVP
jgi:peptidoglycan hydrolase-like protein with peptidoglycan-binding domain